MKRVFLIFFLATQPADAATCHRYSHWAYPWPQRCSVAVAHMAALQPATLTRGLAPAAPPAFDEDAARRDAIEKLKSELQAKGLPPQ